jgi:hypothetical protein
MSPVAGHVEPRDYDTAVAHWGTVSHQVYCPRCFWELCPPHYNPDPWCRLVHGPHVACCPRCATLLWEAQTCVDCMALLQPTEYVLCATCMPEPSMLWVRA